MHQRLVSRVRTQTHQTAMQKQALPQILARDPAERIALVILWTWTHVKRWIALEVL